MRGSVLFAFVLLAVGTILLVAALRGTLPGGLTTTSAPAAASQGKAA